MKYNFDEVIDRKGTHAVKVERLPKGADKDSLALWVADMDFACAEPILKALHERIDRKIFGYTMYEADECMDAVTGWMKKRYGWEESRENLFFCPGVVAAYAALINLLTERGDGIVLQRPIYYPFTNKANSNGRVPVDNALIYENGAYRIDFEDLDKKMADPANKVLVVCSPHNPTGRVWTEDEVRNIVELCKKYSVWLFSDEIHGDVVLYGHQYTSAARFADVYDHMLVYTAISKTFNMAGLHSSCTIIPNPEYKKIQEDTLRQAWLMSPNCMANSAIEACYTYGDEWVDEQNAYLTENAEFVTSYLKEHAPQIKPVKPEGTYLMWLDCSELSMTSEEIVKILASEYKMAVGGGAGYQGNGEYFLRFNIGCPRETLEKGMEILAQFVADKKGV